MTVETREQACAILEVSTNASAKEIEKAYKTLLLNDIQININVNGEVIAKAVLARVMTENFVRISAEILLISSIRSLKKSAKPRIF